MAGMAPGPVRRCGADTVCDLWTRRRGLLTDQRWEEEESGTGGARAGGHVIGDEGERVWGGKVGDGGSRVQVSCMERVELETRNLRPSRDQGRVGPAEANLKAQLCDDGGGRPEERHEREAAGDRAFGADDQKWDQERRALKGEARSPRRRGGQG